MSFDCSWVGFQGIPKDEALAAAGLRDTGRDEDVPEATFNCAELPGGWIIIYAPNSVWAYEGIDQFSANHAVLSVVIQEYVPLSLARFHVRGDEIWSVLHDGNSGASNLSVAGTPPLDLAVIQQRLAAEQQTADAARAKGNAAALNSLQAFGVDYFYHIPVELAAAVCGYRHDRYKFSWGMPKFTEAVEAH